MRALHGTRLVVLFALAIVFAGSLYADSEKPPHGMGKYVIVLWEPGTPVPGHPDERMRRVEKPDVAKAGGRVLSQQVNRMVVYLPFAAAKQLQRHEAVSYIQRIWMGEPFSEWDEDAAATQLRAGNIAANEDPNFTWSKSYSYDADGNITHIGNDSFNYDALQRLTQATVNGSTESYTYDAFGNLTNIASTNGSTAIPTDPGSNRMTGETYDAAGNVTSAKNGARYEFDSMHMMVRYDGAVSGSRRMLYDANDERIGTIVDGTLQRWTIRDFDGQILREFRSNGMSESWIWEQDHIRGEGQLIAGETQRWNYYWEGSNFSYGGHRHYHLDHLGSVRLVTNAAGRTLSENEFYPFGKSQSRQFQEQINGGDPHTDGMRFAGHWRDNLGYPGVEDDNYLDVMHARTYDPNLGRFLSVDPVLNLKTTIHEPQNWNRYAYVENNPVNRVDPDGRCSTAVMVTAFYLCGTIDLYDYVRERGSQLTEGMRSLADDRASPSEKMMAASMVGLIAAEVGLNFVGGGEGRAASEAVLLGENMARVTAGAEKMRFQVFRSTGESLGETMAQNMKWLGDQVKGGARIFDIGLDVSRGGRGGVFFKAEAAFMKDLGYQRQFVKVIKIEGKMYRMYEWVKP